MTNRYLPDFTLDSIARFADENALYYINDDTNPNGQELGNIGAFVWRGVTYSYDENAPSNTASDPFTVVAVDRMGPGGRVRVYSAIGTQHVGNANIFNVVRAVSDPPPIPQIGESYIIVGSPTAEFSSFREHIATWTNHGWRFTFPYTGKDVWNENTRTKWLFNGGFWQQGFPGDSFGDDSILRVSLTFPMGATVIDVGVNRPPDNPNNHDTYIVGTNPTGAWSLYPNLYVYYWNGVWRNHHQAYYGAEVFNQSEGRKYRYNGTAWLPADKQTIAESKLVSVTEPSGQNIFTHSATSIGSRPAWQLGGDNFLPRVIGNNDFIRCQLQDYDIDAGVRNDPNFTPSDNNTLIDYEIRLELYAGNRTTPIMTLFNWEGKLRRVSSGSDQGAWFPDNEPGTRTLAQVQGAANVDYPVKVGAVRGNANDPVKLMLVIYNDNNRVIINPAVSDNLRVSPGINFTYEYIRSTF